jgi:hypothetical protein
MAAAPAAERAPQRAVHPLGPPTTVKHATSLWESTADQPERPRSPYTFRPALRLSGRYGHGQLGVPCKQGVDRASIARSSPAEAVRASPQLPLTRHRRTDSSADCRRTRLRDAEVGSSNLPHPTTKGQVRSDTRRCEPTACNLGFQPTWSESLPVRAHKRFRAGAWRLTVNAHDPVTGKRQPIYATAVPGSCRRR